jgi:hypothetical protein
MTSQSPRIYIYKITFEEVLYYYYGVHKEKKFGEYYMGSPVTHKWCWDFYTPKKQILEIFDNTDEGWLEAQEVETRLIRPFFNTDKWCLNENCGTKSSLKVLRENGRKTAKKQKELGIGLYGLTPEQRVENGKNGGHIGGSICKELGKGMFGLSPEEKRKHAVANGKRGGEKTKENKSGIFTLTKEQLQENGRKTNSQRWQCTETGYISTSSGLSKYQNRRGIDTSKRIRIL